MRGSHDILSFLIRAWSESPNLVVSQSNMWANHPGKTIFVPDFHDEFVMSGLTGFPRWRIFRFTGFHESMHELLSPDKKSMVEFLLEEIARSNPSLIYEEPASNIMSYIINIIEDWRVEKIGLRTYLGYTGERAFRDAVAEEFQKAVEESGDYPRRFTDPYTQSLEDYRRGVLLGLPPFFPDHEFLQPYIDGARSAETIDDVADLTRDLTNDLIKRFGPPPYIEKKHDEFIIFMPGGNYGASPEPVDSDVKRAVENNPSLDEISESLTEEFKAIETERKSVEKCDEESSSVVALAIKGGPVSHMNVHSKWQSGDYHASMAGTAPTINRLRTLLKRWQVGWSETLNDRGDDVEIEEYIVNRISSERKRYFIDEKRIAPKEKIAILLDMSGSISFSNLEAEYLKAVGIIAESLSFVGTKFALFAFTDYAHNGSSFMVIKTLVERWAQGAKGRLAALRASGGTPLFMSCEWVESFKNIEGYGQLIIITDGEPSRPDDCAKIVRRFNQMGLQTGIIGFSMRSSRSQLFDLVRRTGRLKIIKSLSELPMAFFDLVRVRE